MKIKPVRIILVIVIAFAALLVIGVIKNLDSDTVNFEDIEYVRPDVDAMRLKVDEALEKLNRVISAKQFEPLLEDVYSDYLNYNTMYSLAEIRYYQDITDDYYAGEYEYCTDRQTDVLAMFDELYIACAKSPIAHTLEKDFFWEGFVDEYGTDYTGYTDEEYASLARRETDLLNQYRQLIAGATVSFRGEEVYYEDISFMDDVTDEEYVAAEDEYYGKYCGPLSDIYIELVKVRNQQAEHLGYDSYEGYAFDYVYGRDYTPEEAERFVNGVKEYLVPVYIEATEILADKPLYFYLTEDENQTILGNAMKRMGKTTDEIFKDVTDHGFYDIRIDSKKADISFQSYLTLYDMPYAFVKAYGYSDDLFGFTHEFGHCIDSYYNYNGTSSLELEETFSQGLELLLLNYLGDDVSEEELDMMTDQKLYDVLTTFCQQSSFFEFEHQVYLLGDELTQEKLADISLQVSKDYGYFSEGLEDYYADSWVDILHFFEQPYYVISYCTSLDAAMQLYELECKEEGAGLDAYMTILPRDYEGFIETLVEQGKMNNPFDEDRMPANAEIFREKIGA